MKALSVLFDALTFLKKDSLLHPSLQMQPNKYDQCGGRAEISSARKWLFFFYERSSLSFSVSVVLIQVNCLLCIINFLLSPSLFLSPTFNHSFKGPLPRFRPPQCLLKVTAARVRGMLFEAGTKKATHSRRLGIEKKKKSLPLLTVSKTRLLIWLQIENKLHCSLCRLLGNRIYMLSFCSKSC